MFEKALGTRSRLGGLGGDAYGHKQRKQSGNDGLV